MSRSSSRGEIEIISSYSGTVNRGVKKKDDESLYFHGDQHTTEGDLIRSNRNKITHNISCYVPLPTTAMHFASIYFCHARVKGHVQAWICFLQSIPTTASSHKPTNTHCISHCQWIQFSKHKIKHLVNCVYCPMYFPPAIKCQQPLLMC